MIGRGLFVLAVCFASLAPACTCKKKQPAQKPEIAEREKGVGDVRPRTAEDRARHPVVRQGDAGAEGVAAGETGAGRDGAVAETGTGTAPALPVRPTPPKPEDITSPTDPYYESGITNRSTVTLGEPRILEGARDPKRLATVLDRVRKPIASCHLRALTDNPGLAGQIVFELTIDERGVISKAVITRNDLGPEVARCAELRVRGSRFGSGEPARISLPLQFAAH